LQPAEIPKEIAREIAMERLRKMPHRPDSVAKMAKAA
jgi:hypothetical protein